MGKSDDKDLVDVGAEPSDPYLMTGYDRKRIDLSHDGAEAVQMTIELDVTGMRVWKALRTFEVAPGQAVAHAFEPWLGAYWVRGCAWSSTAWRRPCLRMTEWGQGGVKRAATSWVVLSLVRLLDHISQLPSGEKTGRPSKERWKVTRRLAEPSARMR